VAARLMGVPTVCLPHGLNIKLDAAATRQAQQLLAEKPYDWRDRNRFAAYVLNTEHHRQWHLDYAMGDPDVLETWGSLRWAPEWFERNRAIAPAYEWPGGEGRLKVIFMVPKWQKRVDGDAVIELVAALQALDFVSLAVKGHPRPEDGSADPLRADARIDWSRVTDASDRDSVSLIAAADVVIDIGSSIGIETLMQRKVLVNPTYLHELTTFFDQVEDSCVVARSANEVVSYLRSHAAGAPHEVPPEAYDEILRRGVYASKDRPFDVLSLYARRVSGLAESGGARRGSPAPLLPSAR
jgi:hypothetical protein